MEPTSLSKLIPFYGHAISVDSMMVSNFKQRLTNSSCCAMISRSMFVFAALAVTAVVVTYQGSNQRCKDPAMAKV